MCVRAEFVVEIPKEPRRKLVRTHAVFNFVSFCIFLPSPLLSFLPLSVGRFFGSIFRFSLLIFPAPTISASSSQKFLTTVRFLSIKAHFMVWQRLVRGGDKNNVRPSRSKDQVFDEAFCFLVRMFRVP